MWGAQQDFEASNSFRNASPGIKFRRICLISCCGGRGVRESAFSLAWLAEELIHRNTFIILIVPDGGLVGGVYGGRGSAQDSCRTDAGMRKCDELSSCRSIKGDTRNLDYSSYPQNISKP